jgi:hypothetical protein
MFFQPTVYATRAHTQTRAWKSQLKKRSKRKRHASRKRWWLEFDQRLEKAAKIAAAKSCGKDVMWKSQRTTFPHHLENAMRFPLFHSFDDDWIINFPN